MDAVAVQGWRSADIIGLSTIARMSSAAIRRLIGRYNCLDHALDESPSELERVGLSRRSLFNNGSRLRIDESAQRELDRCRAARVSLVSIVEDEYPETLKQIDYPPAVLYVRGRIDSAKTGVALVGTRRNSPYGAAVTEVFAREFAAAGCAVVSGLARGIDTEAHRAALRSGGTTYAVIASGVDRVSPAENARLSDEIIEAGGAILSEYPCGTRAVSAYFPRRNRIICGLSAAVVVMESGMSGGAMITADMARSQGRKLFAVPGPVNASTSSGTNMLIRSGRATMVCTSGEVLKTLGQPANTGRSAAYAIPNLGRHETAICNALLRGDKHIDELQQQAELQLSEILPVLVRLESRGLIRALPGNRYAGQSHH